MQDIFELTWFYTWNFFEKYSFFVIFLFLIFFFFYKYFSKNKKDEKKVEILDEKIDFLEILKKSKNLSLKKYLEIFSLFLEKKYKNNEISKLTFEEFKNLKDISEKEKKLFFKIYFSIYSWKNILEEEKNEIFEEIFVLFDEKY